MYFANGTLFNEPVRLTGPQRKLDRHETVIPSAQIRDIHFELLNAKREVVDSGLLILCRGLL